MGRHYGARPTPAELARRLLLDLEDALTPRLDRDYAGSDALRALRLCREQLVEAIEPAVWRTKRRTKPMNRRTAKCPRNRQEPAWPAAASTNGAGTVGHMVRTS